MRADLRRHIAAGVLSPSVDGALWDAMPRGRFRAGANFPVHHHAALVPPIGGLLSIGRPMAICPRVVAFDVLPLDGVFVQPGAHVRQELLERGAPLCAHGDASPAIVFERLVSRVCAALDHAGPADVLRAGPCQRVMPVLHVHGMPHRAEPVLFGDQAAAAPGSLLVGQQASFHDRLLSAIAVALPTKSISGLQRWQPRTGNQFAESNAGKVSDGHGEF